MSISELIQILLINLINLINVNWILDDPFHSFLNNLLNWNLSYPIDINWFLDSLFNWNFDHLLDRNFNYFLNWPFLVNLSHNVSLNDLLNRSLNNYINWYFDLSVNRNGPLNNDLDFLLNNSLINHSLLSGAVDIHVVSCFLVTWSDFSFLKSCLSDIDILIIPDTPIDLVRFTLSDLNNDSLTFGYLDHFWLSLLFRNQLWISLSDLGNSKVSFSWVKVRWSVIRVAVVARNKSVLRLVVMWLIISLVSLD